MSQVVLVASVPWGVESHAPLKPRSYRLGEIAPLTRRMAPLLSWPDKERRPHDDRIFAKVIRGKVRSTGYHMEMVADTTRPDSAWLLNEIDLMGSSYVVPNVERGRLVSLAVLAIETWPTARLMRSPLGVQPATVLDASPLPPSPLIRLDS
jgi:hypothetical protein